MNKMGFNIDIDKNDMMKAFDNIKNIDFNK
jgi:hypothetical protein